MSVRNILTEQLLLPFSDYVIGNSIKKHLDFLLESQWWSRAQIDDYQNNRLHMMIEHSITTVPYYSKLFSSLGLTSKDIQSKEDLKKIPILSKKEINKYGMESLISNNYLKKKMIPISSSGSTGEPLHYYETKESHSMNIAANLRGWYWMGYKLGDKYIKLSQNPRNDLIKRIQDKLSNNYYLSTSPLIDKNFKIILERIEHFQPKVIRSYPDPLLFLARYKKKNPNFTYEPMAITTTGNTLYPEIRDEIEDVFNCKIFDSYSCEGNANVFECETHSGYHSSEEYGISEVLDDNDLPVENGVGRLISTDLYNYAYPFIRYDTQDQVEVISKICNCGRKLLRYKRILGRSNDIIISSTGEKFIVHHFTAFFQTDYDNLKRSVRHFQIIKTKDDKIKINLVVKKKFDKDVEYFIID